MKIIDFIEKMSIFYCKTIDFFEKMVYIKGREGAWKVGPIRRTG